MAERNGARDTNCYAKVFVRYAYPIQTPAGEPGRWCGYSSGHAFANDLRSQCGG
jgi:hypothetical protein